MNSYYEKFIATGEVKCIDEEIPFEIPQGWEWCRLCHVTEVARGGSPRPIKDYITESPSGINWIKIGDTEKGGKFIFSTRERIKPEGMSKSRFVHKGDFLLTNSMSFGRPYISQVEGCIHDGWLVISLIGDAYCQDFLYYLLSSNFAYAQFSSKVAGAVVQNLNSDKVANSLFPIPPKTEQKRIVQKIELILPKVHQYEELSKELSSINITIHSKLKKSILQEAIQGKLVPQLKEEGTAEELLAYILTEKERLFKEGKLKKSALNDSTIRKGDDNKYWEKKGKTEKDITDEIPFEIPDSWAWVRLNSISDIIGGYAFQSCSLKEEHGKRVIRISDINEKGFVNTKIVRYNGSPISDIYKLQRFDILMAMTGGTVGKSLFVRELPEDELLLNQRVARIRNLWISVDYLNFVIIAPHIKEFISKQKNSTNDNISMADISNFLIPLPSIKEQLRIVEKLYNLASIMRE